MTRGNQREKDRERAAARTAKAGQKADDGLTPQQRRERSVRPAVFCCSSDIFPAGRWPRCNGEDQDDGLSYNDFSALIVGFFLGFQQGADCWLDQEWFCFLASKAQLSNLLLGPLTKP